jgi:hypothetical protein
MTYSHRRLPTVGGRHRRVRGVAVSGMLGLSVGGVEAVVLSEEEMQSAGPAHHRQPR